tara:strand:+ start:39 stop:233 length:195 start_codon:yes stop_codon:yes gene_type:complete
MSNLKQILVEELLELTKGQPTPDLQNYVDYKMFLYTLSTNQLLDSIDYERVKKEHTLPNLNIKP